MLSWLQCHGQAGQGTRCHPRGHGSAGIPHGTWSNVPKINMQVEGSFPPERVERGEHKPGGCHGRRRSYQSSDTDKPALYIFNKSFEIPDCQEDLNQVLP